MINVMINAMKRRRLLIIIIGIGLLVLLTSLATSLDTFFPPKPTAAVQIANVSPYQITLSVAPNPPNTEKPATLSFQIVQTATQQLVSGVHVQLAISMPSMGMGTEALTTQVKSPGIYQAQAQFPMSGTWEIHISILKAGAKTVSTSFDVTA
jgi:hypothetical protein